MQHIGVLMDIDIRSIISNVLLEQTQATDSSGEKTITTYYAAWYREVLLRSVTGSARNNFLENHTGLEFFYNNRLFFVHVILCL